MKKPKLFRIATVPMSLNLLLKGQLEFLNQEFDVTAISSEGKDLEIVAEREGVKTYAIEIHRPISLIQDFKSLWQLYHYFKKEKPDIVHSITPKAGLLSMIAGKLAGVPVRMHTFTGLIFPHKDGYTQKILVLMDKILCFCATHVYPEGLGVKRDLQKFRITNKPLDIIGNGNVNGIDLEYYNPQNISEKTKQDIKLELGIHANDFVYVFVGRLVIDKGLRELVEAFDQISRIHQNVKLILVGPEENERHAEKKEIFSVVNENKKIVSVGYQEDVRPYLSIANVFVLPSYREGFPNSVLQAGSMGLPSLVSDIGGCNEIITEGYNGLLFPAKNIEILKAKMLEILNKETCQKLKFNARKNILKYYRHHDLWMLIRNEYFKNILKNG